MPRHPATRHPQVFYNLRELREKAIGAATDVAAGFSRSVAAALDPAIFGVSAAARGAGGGGVLADLAVPSALLSREKGMPPSSVAPSWRADLWSRVESVAEALFIACLKTLSLQRVLGKKRDPLTHTLFASLLAPTEAAAHAPPAGGAAGAAAVAAPDAWPLASAEALSSHPMLASMLELTGRNAGAVSLADSSAAVAATPSPGGGDDLRVLWTPLGDAIRESFERAAASAPFVRATLWSDLPRLLSLLRSASTRLSQQLAPSPLPAEVSRLLSAERLLDCLPDAKAAYRRDLLATLTAVVDAQLDEIRSGCEDGGGGASDAHAEGARLGHAIEEALGRAAAQPAMLSLAASGCAQAIALLANRAEPMVSISDDPANPAAAALNAALLDAIGELRADVCALLEAGVPDAVHDALRAALDSLVAVTTALANPSTPLPEEKRIIAAAALRQQLRRDMINEGALA